MAATATTSAAKVALETLASRFAVMAARREVTEAVNQTDEETWGD